MTASTGAPPTRAGGVQTQLQTPTAPSITTTASPQQAVLHLRGATREREELDDEGSGPNTRTTRRIQWAEDVIDNEGMGKKSSKVCCIYHAPKGIDESSDESSSDSDDSDSDSGDDGAARPARKEGHSHGHGHSHGKGTEKGKDRPRSPNAYEKQPKVKNGVAKEKG